IDEEGFGVCPDCKFRIHCGPVGVANIRKRHVGSQTCRDNQKKSVKDLKPTKNQSLLGFLRPRASKTPSTVTAPAPIKLVNRASVPTGILNSLSSQESTLSTTKTRTALLGQLEAAIKKLPATVPEATESDVLAVFAVDPSGYVGAKVPAPEIFEHLNPIFHKVLGWNMSTEDTAGILRRGPLGLDGLLGFFQYFVEKRGVREQDFSAKIHQVLDAIALL
ncbi:hypothetical protein B0H19DRAFT_949897, partial [Mycena capillaripes]